MHQDWAPMKLMKPFLITGIIFLSMYLFIQVKRQSIPTMLEINLIEKSLTDGVTAAEIIEIGGMNGEISNPSHFFAEFSKRWRRDLGELGPKITNAYEKPISEKVVFKLRNGRSVDCEILEYQSSCYVKMHALSVGTVMALFYCRK
jgi:hypothetical protein